MMKFLRNLFKRKRGQTFVEYALIAAAIGLVLAVASYQLFEGTKINFYHGLLPTNRERIDLPPAPDGTIPSGYSKPNAVIIGPSTVVLGSEVEYRSESYDHNGRIVRTSWGGNTTKIHFTYEGEYTLELTVWNDKGLSDTTTMTIKIVNNAPVAVIRANPDKDLVHTENVTLHLNDSYDPDGHRITNWEWKLNGQIVNWDKTRTGTLPVGTNTIQLRVADEFGKWSQWVTKTIKVNQNYKPVAVIKANPDRELIHTESVTIDANSSYDPDGDNITQYEWKLNGQSVSWGKSRSGTLPVGTNTIQLRVMDAYGQWSDWVSKTIVVKNNRPPVAVITMTPNSDITTDTTVTFSYGDSYDPDGDAIVEVQWENKKTKYTAGTHTVKLRVKDAYGLWSNWTAVTFTVKEFTAITVKFTNAGATGRYGPTQSQVNSAYSGTPLSGKVTIRTRGIQEWTVPYTGTYKIKAAGARGGASSAGKGAIVEGEMQLTAGQVLKILVGQMGSLEGGGGGTFVAYSNNTPILVAGGGGGNGATTNGRNGSTANSGTADGNNRNSGGTNGNGGSSAGGSGVAGNAGGGAGFYGNGQSSHTSDNPISYSFVNGGEGSPGGGNTSGSREGGFGGGGGGFHHNWGPAGAGGGGYSGGAGGYRDSSRNDGGGGGGSFIHSSMTNVRTSDGRYNNKTSHNGSIGNLNSWNSSHGYVEITRIE